MLRSKPALAAALAAVVLSTVPVRSLGAEPPPDAALHALFEREFQRTLQDHPEMGTLVGVPGVNHRLDDRSPQAVRRDRQRLVALQQALRPFERKRLNTQDRISLALMQRQLRQEQEAHALYGELPFNGLDGWLVVGPGQGPQHSFPMLAKAAPMNSARDLQDYIARLRAMPQAMAQMTDRMRDGLRSGWLPPAAILQRVPAQFEPFVGPLEANPLAQPFARELPGVPAPERERLAAEGRRVLAEQVVPAFAAMKRFIETEYLPGARGTLAASRLPAGPAYYAMAVRAATTTDLTPQQVHETGLAEVRRIGAAMDALVRETGFAGSRTEYARALLADPRSYFSAPEDMLRQYRDIAKRVDAELPRLFAELPRLPYGIRAMEAYEGDNAEHYTPGALDGSRAGFFEANVLSLKTRPRHDMENTLLHEAAPGHHLQTARAQEIRGLPAFRRMGWYVAYGEGWALYAESLGPLLGLYREPASRFGALRWEMLRACRLVVDTGLHAFDWTREQAVQYLVDNAHLARGFAEAEVDRYIADPGQALGYKIGELKIKALRAKAQAALGERFDLRRFHNAVLDDGPLPLTLLERRIDDWIAAQQRAR